jgi:hypothetical protein
LKRDEKKKRHIVDALLNRVDTLPPDKLSKKACPQCGSRGSITLEPDHVVEVELNDSFKVTEMKTLAYVCQVCDWESYPEESMRDIMEAEAGKSYVKAVRENGSLIKVTIH